MTEQFKIGEQSFDVVVRAYGEANKGFQAVAAEVTDYSKNTLEDATHAYAKRACDAYIAVSKLDEMWVGLARDAYKPVERPI